MAFSRNLTGLGSVTRRMFVGGASGSLAAVTGAGVTSLLAQEATPDNAQVSPDEPAATPSIEASPVPPEVLDYAGDWPTTHGNLAATRVAQSSNVSTDTVNQLGVAWELDLDAQSGFGAVTSNPIVQGNTIYLIDNAGNVQSINKETGDVNWKNDYNVPTNGPNGLAVGYGYLVSVLGDTAEVVTHVAETGEEVWRFQITNHSSLGITVAPMIFDGFVVVSTGVGGNPKGIYGGGAHGMVFCLDLETGETLWKWDTTKDDLWGNFRENSGAGVWYPPAVDVETGVLYIGVGNPGPWPGSEEFPNAESRPGPNDYACCIVALDQRAGKVLWYENMKPHDLFDHDNQNTPVVADVEINGETVPMVFASGKHGYIAGFNRNTGERFWKTAVGKHQNNELTKVPEEGVVVLPGFAGGVIAPIAYKDGKILATAQNNASFFTPTGQEFGAEGLPPVTSNVMSIDAATGEILWDVEIETSITGPGPTVANDIFFVGAADGKVRAFDIEDGNVVWEQQMAAGINASLAIAGDYLLVPAGTFISQEAFPEGDGPTVVPRLVAFKLGATGEVTLG